jgi:hypothetical protein
MEADEGNQNEPSYPQTEQAKVEVESPDWISWFHPSPS